MLTGESKRYMWNYMRKNFPRIVQDAWFYIPEEYEFFLVGCFLNCSRF